MKIASWNVNSLKVRMPHLLDWLGSARPDLVGLQETKCVDEAFPHEAIEEAGYRAIFTGQKTYNGVAILSRLPAEADDIVHALPGLEDPQKRVIAATYADVRFINLYVPNGGTVDSDKYAYKLDWLAKLHAWLAEQLKTYEKLVVVGDFNIAPDERDVHDPELWAGQVLFSEPERTALRGLLDLGLVDTFRLFEQEENSFSWWDYRMGAFRRNRGLRIDHVLASTALARHCTGSWIDKEPRRWERPSDHAPAVAEFAV